MNNHPEAVRARHNAQMQLLAVIESMIDGDTDDSFYHLSKWRDARSLAISFERTGLAQTTEITIEQQKLREARTLLQELHERWQYSDLWHNLPLDISCRIQRAINE